MLAESEDDRNEGIILQDDSVMPWTIPGYLWMSKVNSQGSPYGMLARRPAMLFVLAHVLLIYFICLYIFFYLISFYFY